MNIKNTVYFTPYEELEARGISFADHAKGKSFYHQLAPIFDAMNSREEYTSTEVGFLVAASNKFGNSNTESFLDIACGTGRHARQLTTAGYQVWAIDCSDDLLDIAIKANQHVKYIRADMRTFDLGEKHFDCAYSLWDSYVYLSRPEDMVQFAERCATHVNPGGIMILDSKNYRKQSPIDGLEYRLRTLGNYEVETMVRRRMYATDKVFEALFTTIIRNHKTKKSNIIIDQTLARVFTEEDIRFYFPEFEFIGCFGDFNLDNQYDIDESERLIVILKKK